MSSARRCLLAVIACVVTLLVLGEARADLAAYVKKQEPDFSWKLRNTRVTDIIGELKEYAAVVDVWDPWVDTAEAKHEYGLDVIAAPKVGAYDAIVLAVAHSQFAEMGADKIRALGKADAVLFDVKGLLPMGAADLRL